jgi:bifunctional non-homologous end joining protein LigD
VREKNAWRYIGHVGTGFSHKTLEELHGKLMPLKAAKSPFPAKVKHEAVTTWVRPSWWPKSSLPNGRQQGKCGILYTWGFAPTSGRPTLSGKHRGESINRKRQTQRENVE